MEAEGAEAPRAHSQEGVTNKVTMPPTLPLYARDWLTDSNVRLMPALARAYYVDLLCQCWLNDGYIPAELEDLQKLVAGPKREWQAVWPHIEPRFPRDPTDPTRRFNRRQARIIADQDAYRQAKSRAGKASARARAEAQHNGQQEANRTGNT